MTPRKRQSRIYWRTQGGVPRAYLDVRDFADVGGRLEALIPPGSKRATDDPEIAEQLAAERLIALQRMRKSSVILGTAKRATLGEYIRHHLIEKKKSRLWTDEWIAKTEKRLGDAMLYFEAAGARDLTSIGVEDVQDWASVLASSEARRGNQKTTRFRTPATVRHYLNALSNLYRRAGSEGYVPPGYNPVAAMMEKPKGEPAESEWLEVPDAALLLESARLCRDEPASSGSYPAFYELLATMLLAGLRVSEATGLLVADVSFDRKTITVRPNKWRRIKNRQSRRVVPLWPQLEAILREYVFGGAKPLGKLLFPRIVAGQEQPVGDFRKTLDTVAERAGWQRGDVRARSFRHTYCAARLQTLDGGKPVAIFTVSRELGHGGETMVKRVYAHLGEVRHRARHVEYRVEQHRAALAERLEALRHS